jgi:hypothetical protein
VRKEPSPLSGAPAVRREKNYTAESGYVYHYFYRGNRPAKGGTEHVFEVSADRHGFILVSVVLGEAALARWRSSHARDLASTEQYALAKMSLLRAFDQCPHPPEMQREVIVSAADVAEILATLGID